ncbi:RHS repeat-associated core domain-containing protein, partial [Gallibacterium anatis]
TAYQGMTYHYDEFGNLSQRILKDGEVQTYHYNAKDKLIKVMIQKPNQAIETWQYQYDVLGRRIGKVRLENGEVLPNTQKQFIWDGSHLVQEIEHKTDRTFTYIYSHPSSYEPLAQLAFSKGNENPTACYYYHNDQIGIPRELTDEQGKLCWYANYSGWGKVKEEYDLTKEKSIHQPFRLQNQYADEETGLHYNFFRYYEPNIGRFTQLDPIGLLGGNNLYLFAINIYKFTDVFGLEPMDIGASMRYSPPYMGESSFRILSQTLDDMKRLNLTETDQFFHCSAFCRVSKSTAPNKELALEWGKRKEQIDKIQNFFGLYGNKGKLSSEEMEKNSAEDLAVNEYGLRCPKEQSCSQRCERYLNPNHKKTKERLREEGYLQ